LAASTLAEALGAAEALVAGQDVTGATGAGGGVLQFVPKRVAASRTTEKTAE